MHFLQYLLELSVELVNHWYLLWIVLVDLLKLGMGLVVVLLDCVDLF